MEENRLISILMPVRDNDAHLAETVDSILAQTEREWELLAVLNRSTDDSRTILERYADSDNRIKVLECEGECEGIGILDGLATGLAHAAGGFVTRMDADDIMPPEKLARLKGTLTEAGRGYIATGHVEYFSDGELREGYIYYAGWLNRLMDEGRSFDEIYKECPIPSPCWMMHREDLISVGGFTEGRYPEDYDLAFRIYRAGFKLVVAEGILHRWRDHSERASRTEEEYADRYYFPLKLDYFMELELKDGDTLYLWGAGRRGKELAKLLLKRGIGFRWITDNRQKSRQNIYGITVEPPEAMEPGGGKVIVAVSVKPADEEIAERLRSAGMKEGQDFFRFC